MWVPNGRLAVQQRGGTLFGRQYDMKRIVAVLEGTDETFHRGVKH